MTSFQLSTERLILRPHQREDIPFMVKLNSDPEVVRYTGNGPIDESQAEAILIRCASQFNERKIGRFVVLEKSTGEKLGWSGLIWIEDRKVFDIGYRFLQEKWGRGYATESSLECLRYGFRGLQLNEITAEADARNTSSLKVLKKLGLQQIGRRRDDDGDILDFRITKDQYDKMTVWF